jgi:16S rRNA (uracil1498-N3)-methyltransferase
MPRFYCPTPLSTGQPLSLPAGAARHVQVLRLQPGDVITLFNGDGGEFEATVTRMGRSDVDVDIGVHHAVEREAVRAVHLLAGITANERMDWLVEKATELGVASITPLVAERSVLKLKGERAEKKLAHWQGIAVASAEQCGRNRVPKPPAMMTIKLGRSAGAVISSQRCRPTTL